ncbi:hypothetical protein QC764_309130 [Podospora pseudoanserina]|uniref:Uncharacterized protein n=1 Tax=Podospora pseudoanserina TaxID=2609844 RepID=A0ABR0IDY4_9PEZI|nr:hypothetical protein QC764_309130 [Podospora pseudoanserina]
MQFKMGYSRAQQGAVPRGFGGPSKPSSKHVEGQLDPEDLTRRLLLVLAEQEEHEKRRQRRAEQQSRHRREHQSSRHGQSQSSKTQADPRCSDHSRRRPSQANTSTSSQLPEPRSTDDHYVPKEAARQFTRTTTVEQMRSNDFIHQLSKRAHRYHKDSNREGDPIASTTPADLARQLRQSQAERDRALERERQQRQPPPSGPSTSSPSSQQQSHTFRAELARLNTNHNRVSLTGHYPSHQPRRNSTGGADPLSADTIPTQQPTTRRSMLVLNPTLPGGEGGGSEDTTTPTSEDPTPLQRFPIHAPEHRVDWSQSDERSKSTGTSRPRLMLSPLLKRADSLFTLRSSKGKEKGGSSSSAGSGSGSVVTSPTGAGAGGENGGVLSSGLGTMLPSPTRAVGGGELPALEELSPPPPPPPPPPPAAAAAAAAAAAGEKGAKSPTSAKSATSGKGFFGRFKR